MRFRLLAFIGLAAVLVLARPSSAQDDKFPPGVPVPTPEQMKEMMAMYEKAAQPAEPHKQLQKLAGRWNTVARTCEMPGTPAQETKGSSEWRAILGGRQMIQESQGTMMGKQYYGFQTFSDLLEAAEDDGLIVLDYDDSRGNYKVRSKPSAAR